ncbi:MAG: OmpH family outer membrane protein [Deltaproteobacteria bacterium]|nr:OmpH family outer membrane protein [Deltaproteobacteria bacterium]
MKKTVVILMAIALATLPYLTVLAAEPEASSAPKPALTEKGVAAEVMPTAPKNGASPASALPVKTEQSIKIGVIDMTKIARDSNPGKAAYAEVKATMEKYQKQIKSKETQLQKQKATIEAQMPSLPPTQRAAKAKEFQKKLESFQGYIQKAEKDIRAREAELMKKLYQSVEKSASDYGKTNGYAAIVLNKELLFTGNNVHVEDLTAETIKLLHGHQGK